MAKTAVRGAFAPMKHPGAVPDYTTAFLVSAGVLTFMALCTIWAIWGLIVAGLVSWGADRVMVFKTSGE